MCIRVITCVYMYMHITCNDEMMLWPIIKSNAYLNHYYSETHLNVLCTCIYTHHLCNDDDIIMM